MNRSDRRAATSPPPVVDAGRVVLCGCGWPVPSKMAGFERRRRRAAQTSLFPEPDVDVDGKRVR